MSEEDQARLDTLRHSAAHVLAQAVLKLWPDAKYAGGPAIENGFYYDFDIGRPFTPEDLERIEAKMTEIVAQAQPFERDEVPATEAQKIFKDQPYKLEWIQGIADDAKEQGVGDGTVSLYRNGSEFIDLCRGPHVSSTAEVKAFKLLRSSGAYWLGNETNPMLQRIYGTAWETPDDLRDHLHRLEEQERRDHRKLGRELELFMTHPLVGAGLPLWLPNGAIVRSELERYLTDLERAEGYIHVSTPHVAKREMYEISGHWHLFKETMFPPMKLDHEELVMRPMNCPHHIMVYKFKVRSYRDLPMRVAEFGTMYRFELSGAVSGLSRVRAMTLNDAHIFCRPDQIKDEFRKALGLVQRTFEVLGITEYRFRLSLRDAVRDKWVDNDEMWEMGERMLREAAEEEGLDYFDGPGEAAFYGPKLDIQVRDLVGREETMATIQLDFHMPSQFEMEYKAEDGELHRPVMIHRGVIGTLERMIAYLIELYGGAFPTWLAPVQVVLVPIAERHHEYATSLAMDLRSAGVRVEVDSSNETLGNRVRKATTLKVPYLIVAGDKEVEAGSVSVRPRGGDEKRGVPRAEFVSAIVREISEKRLQPS